MYNLKRAIYYILFAAMIYIPSTILPCTSFVVFSNHIYYGMNFDWPDTEIRFCIDYFGDTKGFHFQFYKINHFSTTAGMNENGVFCSIQMMYPEVTSWETGGMNLWELFLYSMSNLASVSTLISNLDTNNIKINHIEGSTLHNILSDQYGNAFVIEVGETDNKITQVENGMLVMANFENYQFRNQNYNSVYGAGSDRYKAAYEYILNHKDNFTFNDGFETLERSIQPTGSVYPTQCSMLFDPAHNDVYFALRRDFSRIWKLSVDEGTVETYSGFETHQEFSIGSPGAISSSQLLEAAPVDDGTASIPDHPDLCQNYPNPFNPSTTIHYHIPRSGQVNLRICNLAGQTIETLVSGFKRAGDYETIWRPENLPGGIYLYWLKAGEYRVTKKLIFCK